MISKMSLLRNFPAKLSIGSNGIGAKSAPVKIVALSGEIIDHPEFGRLIFDYAGMSVPSRIPLDYEHCEEIGYLNNFDVVSGQLVCSGAIVPVTEDEDDYGVRIITLAAGGVPYQASVYADDLLLEFIPEGLSVTVNGNL